MAGEVMAAGPGEGRREDWHGKPGRGGTLAGAGRGGAGGLLKEAEISASNSGFSAGAAIVLHVKVTVYLLTIAAGRAPGDTLRLRSR
jgi:hypothetical protein